MPSPNVRLYTGPAVPTAYDPTWQTYTNLTQDQILAFQSFPQDLSNYATTRRWLAEIGGTTVTLTLSGSASPTTIQMNTSDRDKLLLVALRQSVDDLEETATIPFKDGAGNFYTLQPADVRAIHAGVVGFIGQLFAAEGQLLAGVNAKKATVTTRKQIDAALAALAPNSVSATNPSAT